MQENSEERLKERILELEAELARKEQVIRDLAIAAQERLALIEELSDGNRERGPGLANFFNQHYARHNEARLKHLASLGLPLNGRSVLEVGAGPGHHTGFYVQRGCRVVATDARVECTQEIASKFPSVRTAVIDMNHAWALQALGKFEIVHCYGLLYHLEDPESAIREMAFVCTDLLLLETCVSARGNSINLVPEVEADYTQSITGQGCRPGREWVFSMLQREFPFVYQTRTQPDHEEFPVDWENGAQGEGLIRIVTVASRTKLDNPLLSPTLLDHQERFLG